MIVTIVVGLLAFVVGVYFGRKWAASITAAQTAVKAAESDVGKAASALKGK